MGKPCAVFWDIQNVNLPKGKSVDFIVDLIRSAIIKPHNLNEIFFFCVCDVHKLPSSVGHSLTNVDFQAHNGVADSAAIKIVDLMRKFVAVAGLGCTIILLSGDSDYYGTLIDLKKLHNVSIHLIRLADSFASKLDRISDYTFILNNGVLKPIKSTGLPMYFISIKNYPLTFNINRVIDELDDLAIESIENSAVLCGDSIFIGFLTLWNAESSIGHLNGLQLDNKTFLKAELLEDSPLTEILKCIKPVQSRIKNEVRQLTFIKMNNSNEADDSKIIKFCIACTLESGSQCILSTKSYLWIVFSFKSDAQKFLPKVQMLYPKAFISEPPIGLTFKCLENPYFVESCEEIVTNGVSSNVTSRDVHNDIDWKIFFRYNCDFIPPMPYYEPTKWALLYNLFEKLYDLGAKKVIFDGNLFCVHFDSASKHQYAYEKLHSLYLEPLESVDASEAHKLKAAKKMNRYSGIPWCLNEQLSLSCLVIKTDSQFHNHFMDIDKNILGNHECIFVKSIPGEIWIGFPDELICKDSEKTVIGLLPYSLEDNVSMAKPSNELLESINFRDLAGDAYDLAFLSSQLEDLEPIKRPKIIERIKMQRTQEQECNGSIFHFSVRGKFYDRWLLNNLKLEQVVKILVKLSKVIPLAATASYDEVNLMYNSWHEAHAARHFIKKLKTSEVPYFSKFGGTSIVQQFASSNYSEYYIINDKRKVLEKIVQNKNPVEKIDLTSTTAQSTTDIDLLDKEMMKKTQNFFITTTSSGFKFTSGMISIIKLNLVKMDCSVCIDFEDKIWVGVEDLEKGKKAKVRIEKIKFKILHEYEDDFEVGVAMESIQEKPPKVTKMLANKLMNPKESARNVYLNCDVYPLGHFNYSFRKAVGISTNQYCRLNEMFPPKNNFDISI